MTESISSWVFPIACRACGERTATPVTASGGGKEITLTVRCALCEHAWELTCEQPTLMRSPRSGFESEVASRFGVLPNFFCSADAAPGLIAELWKFASAAYLDSPLPSLFKERLFVQLSRFCRIRYCIVRHVGFLVGLGRPSGDAAAAPETVQQVVEMLRRDVPTTQALSSALERLTRMPRGSSLPAPGTQLESDMFDALTTMFVAPASSTMARAAMRHAVGDATFEMLVAFLAFVRTAHYWTEMHPELALEADVVAMLGEHRELAAVLLDSSEAGWLQGGAKLREALEQLEQAGVERVRAAEALALLQGEVIERRAAETQIKALFQRLISVQEAERRRVARELHDQLGQQITGLRLQLEAVPQIAADDRARHAWTDGMKRLAEELDRSIDFLTHGLRPPALGHLGLAAALRHLVDGWSERFGIPAEFHVHPESLRLPDEVEANLYRVAQEALHNVVKHAAATRVALSCQAGNGQVMLTIEDNGRGFAVDDSTNRTDWEGLGLVMMRERAMLAGGVLNIESQPGQGTTILVRVPLAGGAFGELIF